MQLDRTNLVIRTRSAAEIGDLTWMVLRRYPVAVSLAFTMTAWPWMVINMAVLSPPILRESRLGLGDAEAYPEILRYVIWMLTLVFLQCPLAGLGTTYYLGQAVFERRPAMISVWRQVRRRFWPALWVLGVQRLALIATLVCLGRLWFAAHPFFDGFLPFVFVVVASIHRAARPFAPEILLLEQCPLKKRRETDISFSFRSAGLHVPMASELTGRFVLTSIVLAGLTGAIIYSGISVLTLLAGNRGSGLFSLLVLVPIGCWTVAAVSVVTRFLQYLDTRIRLEGWDVELALRAEAQRQFGGKALSDRRGAKASKIDATPPTGAITQGASPVTAATVARGWLIGFAVVVGGTWWHGEVKAQTPGTATVVSPAEPGVSGVSDSVWYDEAAQTLRPIEVADSTRDSVHRDSRWLPEAKSITNRGSGSPAGGTAGGAGGGGGGGGGAWGGLGTAPGWLVIVVLLFVLAAIVAFLLQKMEPKDATVAGKRLSRRAIEEDDEAMIDRINRLPPQLRRTDVNMRSEAERLMNAGQFDLAVILLYGHQLLLLDRAGWLRLGRHKTNRQYLRECRRSDVQGHALLQQTVESFESSYFGDHSIAPERFEQLWRGNLELETLTDRHLGRAA